jgi:hypothetical protein
MQKHFVPSESDSIKICGFSAKMYPPSMNFMLLYLRERDKRGHVTKGVKALKGNETGA